MSIVLGCIADDYTGASDLASMLSHNGLRTVQTIGVPRESLALPPVDAVVVSLKSRSIAAAEAVALSLEADRWLRARGAGRVMFKVCSTFNSTDAGNIGPVTDALRAQAGGGSCWSIRHSRKTAAPSIRAIYLSETRSCMKAR